MNISVVTPPLKLPVTVDELKEHLRIPIDDDDRDLERKIKAVVASLDPPDGRLGRAMITQTLRYSLPEGSPDHIGRIGRMGQVGVPWFSLREWPPYQIRLPYPPVQSIVSFSYLNWYDEEKTIDPSTYVLKKDQDPAFLVLKYGLTWPNDLSMNDPSPFKIDFVAGYGDRPENVPEDIRLGIMMEVGDLYMLRENIILGQTIAQNEFTRHIYDNYIWKHYQNRRHHAGW